MQPYQEEYLDLLRTVCGLTLPNADSVTPEEFSKAVWEANRTTHRAVERGTELLRQELFPVLDNILTAPDEEIADLSEFAGQLNQNGQLDVGLNYRIHMALLARARHRKDRDGIIREQYHVGMALHNLEEMLLPQIPRMFTTRMRMCFMESASYFETEYDDITDPEIRGYIHRSMGNLALTYSGNDQESAQAKLAACTRSITLLSDPELRAKTPSLPWDLYLYKSHQERTTLLGSLRTGYTTPEMFAQVLESAQIVQDRQLRSSKERGLPPSPRWQYAYMAARYHCGVMQLPELLDRLYALHLSREETDMSADGLFAMVSVPNYYIRYLLDLKRDPDAAMVRRVRQMVRSLRSWIARAPNGSNDKMLMSQLVTFLYIYREDLAGIPFFELFQDVCAARQPTIYVRMWLAGRVAAELTDWAVEDCPERLVGLAGCQSPQDVIWRRRELAEYARKAGQVYDTGMIHFRNLENDACRGLFEEEESMLRLHPYCGARLLRRHASTAEFCDIARGHHRYYDGKGGYPLDFTLNDSPQKAMISLVAVADALASSAEETSTRCRPAMPFDQICQSIREGSGKQYAPYVSALLDPAERREALAEKLEVWRKEAYLDMYRRRTAMLDD